jgi:CubicO group peptidase (beta-lactamase class C family)
MVLAPLPALAAIPPAAASSPTAVAPHAQPRLDGLEGLVDGLLERQLREHNLPGAAVAIVQGGRLVHAEGYGYGDAERKIPVDPGRTLFRTGSVGKLFTWTAVMQLAEQGRVRLDEDINAYLDFHIPISFGRPVTLANLLTHTAGFEDRVIGLFARGPAEVRPLGAYLASTIPARVRPPGEVTAYSNYGAALAGYIVQRVSGMPFERYLEERVFGPLGMHRSTVRQPVPPTLVGDLATGYELRDGRQRPRRFAYVQAVPAGSASSTVTDMARFMSAQLQLGRAGNGRILRPETVRLMQARQFANHPRLNGVAYGFYEQSRNGRRLLVHDGNMPLFPSKLALLPALDLGIYVVANGVGDPSEGRRDPREELVDAVVDRYLPARGPAAPTWRAASNSVRRYAGSYRLDRASTTTLEKLYTINQIRVTAHRDGTVTTTGNLGGDNTGTVRWLPVAAQVFREEAGQDLIAFRVGGRGAPSYLFVDDVPIEALVKVPWWQQAVVHVTAVGASVTVLLITVVVWPPAAVAAWYRGRRDRDRLRRTARSVAWLTSLLVICSLIGLLLITSRLEANLFYEVSTFARIVLGLSLVVAAATVALVVFCLLAWLRRWWGLPRRMWYSLVALAAVTYVGMLGFYNLLGFRY